MIITIKCNNREIFYIDKTFQILLKMSTTTSTPCKTFLVIGATGATGRHFLRQALDQGHHVRAIVRTPSKLPQDLRQHPHFTVIEGSFTEATILERAFQNTDTSSRNCKIDGVVCMAGDAQNRTRFMTALVKEVVRCMRKYGVKRFLYQAGAFSQRPQPSVLSWPLCLGRCTIARLLGIYEMVLDNDGVIAYLDQEARDVQWTVTLPTVIVEAPTKGALVGLSGEAPSTLFLTVITFEDLARFSLEAVQQQSTVHCCDYLVYNT